MGTITATLRDDLLDHTLNADTYTPASTIYLCLCTADPTDAATGASMNECANSNAYQRTAITFGAASSRQVTQNAQVVFPRATGSWGTVSHWAIADTQTYGSGDVLAFGAFTSSESITTNIRPSVASGEIYVNFTGEISNYLGNAWLDFVFRNQAFSSPSTYVGLTTATISNSDTGSSVTEVSGGSYARKQVNANGGSSPTWDQASSAVVDNTHAIEFVAATASWGTVTSFFVVDASSAGNLLFYDNGVSDTAVASGETYTFQAGALDIEIDP